MLTKEKTGYKQTEIGLIPDDWKCVKSKEIFENFSQKNNIDEELLSVTQDKGVIPRNLLETRVTMPEGSTSNYKLVEKGNFVISLRSFQGGLEYSSFRGLVSPAYTVLKNKIDIEQNFYRYFFKTETFISSLNVAVIGIRDGKQINYKDFAEIYIPLPPLPEQKKIVEILATLGKAISLKEELIKEKKLQKKYLMDQLLTGKKRFVNVRHCLPPTGYKQTEIGLIPEDWDVKKLKELSEIIDPHPSHRAPKEVKNGIPFIGIGDIKEDGTILLDTCRKVSPEIADEHEKNYKISYGSLGYGRVASIGKIVRLKKFHFKYAISPTMAIVNPYQDYIEFIPYVLDSKEVLAQIRNEKSGSTRQSLGILKLREVLIPLPPIIEQQKIASVLSTCDQEIDLLEQELKSLKDQKKGLMQLLLTGKIRVNTGE